MMPWSKAALFPLVIALLFFDTFQGVAQKRRDLEDSSTAQGKFQLGQYFLGEENYAAASQCYQKALAQRFEKEQSAVTATIYNDLGYISATQGKQVEMMNYYLKAVRIYEKCGDDTGLSETLSNISSAYLEMERKKDAIDYALRSAMIRERLKDWSALALSYNNIANIYLSVDSLSLAEEYMIKGMQYAERSGVKARMAQAYLTYSLMLARQKKYSEALMYEQKDISIYEQTQDFGILSNRYIAAGFYYAQLKDSVNAVNLFEKSRQLAQKINNKVTLRNVYFYLSEFYRQHRNFAGAYSSYKDYINYRDSLQNEETKVRIAALEDEFQTEKKGQRNIAPELGTAGKAFGAQYFNRRFNIADCSNVTSV